MDRLIKVVKDSFIFFIITILFIQCGTIKRNNKSYETIIWVGSVFDDENCSLLINDSLIFQNKKINTERSWGIDPRTVITNNQKGSQLKIKMNCDAKFEIIDGRSVSRNVKIDTLVDLRRGRNILITIRDYSIDIGQSKKKIIFD